MKILMMVLIVTKLILKTSKKLIDNTHKKASSSTAIDMKVASNFGTRRYWLKKLSKCPWLMT
jgi:hypothetical protein